VIPDIDVVIMAHPDRAAHARHLAVQLTARIVWDQGHGEWDTGRRAWQAIRPTSQWGVVVQDDALPIPRARHHMSEALAHAPQGPVSFYVGTGRPWQVFIKKAIQRARRTKASWLECTRLYWGVAIALPTTHIDPMLHYAATSGLPYDERISAYYMSIDVHTRYTWPSLVDHQDGEGLVDHSRWKPCVRVAHEVGVPDTWTGHAERIRTL